MEPEGIEVLLQILRLHRPQAILELGSAIGYSAIRMAETLPDARIVTIERIEARIELQGLTSRRRDCRKGITLIEGDALEAGPKVMEHGPFDIIFVDAAKGQYKRFFELFEPFLADAGIIITDNVLFKGLVAENIEEMEMTRRKRALIKKIRDFNIWLHDHPHFDTVILPIGDGVAISKHRGDKNEKA